MTIPIGGPLARSVQLRSAPSLREARGILGRLGRDLEARGATVETRAGDALTFRMPLPWRAPRPTWLLAANSGNAIVTAGGGGPWRVRFALRFGRLRLLSLASTAALLATGMHWPRLALINAVATVWVLYFVVGAIATRTLARLVRAASADVAERRRTPRESPAVRADGDGGGEPGRRGGTATAGRDRSEDAPGADDVHTTGAGPLDTSSLGADPTDPRQGPPPE